MAADPLDATIHDLTLLAEGRVTVDAFYTHVSPPPADDGTVTMGWPDYTARFRRIEAALRAAGFDPDAVLDYRGWIETLSGDPQDPATIARMSADDLRHWAVWTARGERFCDGFMAGLLERGAYLAALRRAREIGPQPAR